MSDQQDDGKKGKDEPEGGKRYGGADLAKDVRLSPELPKTGGPDLNDVDAQHILNERLGGDHNEAVDLAAGDISEIIVDSLPKGMRTPEVLGMLDLRPYLAALDGKTIQHRYNAEHGVLDIFSFLQPDVTSEVVADTKPYLEKEQARLKEAGVENLNYTTTAGVSPMPTKVDENGDPTSDTTANGETIPIDPLTGEPVFDTVAGKAKFTSADLRYMVQSDQWTLEDQAANEGKADSPALIDTGVPGARRPIRAGAVPTDQVKSQLTAQEALGYLQSLPPDKIKDMQSKLANAGYYDGLDNGGNYLVGDSHDQNTVIAMRRMLTEADQTKKPIAKLVGERMKSYRMNVRETRLAGLKQDPGYSRAAANDYAQQIIGRDLDPDEQRQVDMYLKSLVRSRAGHIGGNTDIGGGLEADNPRGYDEGDVRAALDQSSGFQEDARGKNDRTFDFKLRQLMH